MSHRHVRNPETALQSNNDVDYLVEGVPHHVIIDEVEVGTLCTVTAFEPAILELRQIQRADEL